MSSEGFLTDLATVELFFRFCRRYHVEKEADRVALMRELTRRKKARYLRDVGEFTRGKSVLKIGPKLPHNPGPEHMCPECSPKEPR